MNAYATPRSGDLKFRNFDDVEIWVPENSKEWRRI